jgi:hypothetical protein
MLTTGLWLSVLIWILLVVMGCLLIRFWSRFGVA